MRTAGLPATCLHDGESLIPVEAASTFRELVARQIGSADIALKSIEHLEVTDLGDFGVALLKAPTLSKSFTQLNKLVGTQTSNVSFELHPCADDQFWFCHRGLSEIETGRWHRALYTLAWMLKIVRLVEPCWSPTEIWIDTKSTQDRLAVIESMGSAARFEHDCTGFLIPARMLALPPADNGAVLTAQDAAVDQLWSTSPSITYAEALRQIIRSYASDGWLSIQQASEATNTSVRTMQRRLSAEKTTYSQVIEETRSEIAGQLLQRTALSMTEISQQLGYRNPGDFTRAFRRWAGISPSEFRKHRCCYGELG